MPTQAVELPVPPAVLLARCADEPYVFALDGGNIDSWGEGVARFGFGPRAVLRVAADGSACVLEGKQRQIWQGHPFALLDRFRTAYGSGVAACSGIVAALSYDLRCFVERLAPRPLDPPILLHAAAYDWLLTYSYGDGAYRLSSATRSAADLRAVAAHLAACAARRESYPKTPALPIRAQWSRTEYETAVRRALEYIAAGDIYQVNLAQRFVANGNVNAPHLFCDMRRSNPVPYAAYVDAGDCKLVSNSPECLFTLRGSRLSTFPIKGTRPRGSDPSRDAELIANLQCDEKERAEHIMIVDLERNDLGRVCTTGSVRVDELAKVRTFPGLHHMVSTVRGELKRDMHLADILLALFPGGSITGAPKIRAMEIIDELEPVSRGFYTGSIGFLSSSGEVTFNIAIRTAVVTGERVEYHAGGGIVADSQPENEYAETILKAQPFFAALQARPT
ncbi:MAG: aminodeoxychorismate synthase component I [Deltaproteobacteria bacterium]|nr:aminodeoxychorismate synthase component I [Deltaproteobacteria bacterium]